MVVLGTGFGAPQGSSVAALNGLALTVNSWSPISVVFNVPSGATSGNVVVTVGGVASNGIFFTVTPPPSITSLNPTSGGTNTTVQISGSNFGAAKGSSTVTFNGVVATTNGWTAGSITALVPLTASTGNVVVTVSGVASNGVNYTVQSIPNITGLTPPAAEVYGTVTLGGTGFGANKGSSVVYFNGVAAATQSWGDTSVVAIVPAGATNGPVTLTEAGITSNGVPFTVDAQFSITGISPSFGPAGTTVYISGIGFGASQSSSTISFNGSPASVNPNGWSDTQIVAIVPAAATTGLVSVQVAGIAVSGPSFEITSSMQLTDSLGHQSSYTSTVVGGKALLSSAQGSGCSSCTVRGTIQYQYDSFGNVLSRTDELGRITSYSYDSSNNVTSVSQPAIGGSTPTTSYTYNNFGEVLTMTDPLGHVTTNTYDSHGNLTSVTSPSPGGTFPCGRHPIHLQFTRRINADHGSAQPCHIGDVHVRGLDLYHH